MSDKNDSKTRREFLKTMGAVGLTMSTIPFLGGCLKRTSFSSASEAGYPTELEFYSMHFSEFAGVYASQSGGSYTGVVLVPKGTGFQLDMTGWEQLKSGAELKDILGKIKGTSVLSTIRPRSIMAYPCGEGQKCEMEAVGVIISQGDPKVVINEANPKLLAILPVSAADAEGGGGGGGGSCFVAGTQITMSNGNFKNIEDVKAGDEVLTFNEEKEENESQKVLETKSHLSNHYYEVQFEDGTVLKVTENHPLLSRNGWSAINVGAAKQDKGVECQNLLVRDEILSSDGNYKKIVSMDRIDGEIVVYDLSKVAVTHTFFVEGVLAHNKGSEGGSL